MQSAFCGASWHCGTSLGVRKYSESLSENTVERCRAEKPEVIIYIIHSFAFLIMKIICFYSTGFLPRGVSFSGEE